MVSNYAPYAQGQMSANGNYPSDSGLAVGPGVQYLAGRGSRTALASLTITKTPGSGATYKLQQLMKDSDQDSWVDIGTATITGNGAAATGHFTVRFTGVAIRLVAVNGTSPGTGSNTPFYVLRVYRNSDQGIV